MCEQSNEIRDLDALVGLVDQDRIAVAWTVTSALGPEWIGSTRHVSFYVNGIPLPENPLIQRLVDVLVEAILIPETSKDRVISGEGKLRRRGNLIEMVYEWSAAIPYDWPSDSGSCVVTLINLGNN